MQRWSAAPPYTLKVKLLVAVEVRNLFGRSYSQASRCCPSITELAGPYGTFLHGNDGEAKAVCLKKRSQEIQSSQPEL